MSDPSDPSRTEGAAPAAGAPDRSGDAVPEPPAPAHHTAREHSVRIPHSPGSAPVLPVLPEGTTERTAPAGSSIPAERVKDTTATGGEAAAAPGPAAEERTVPAPEPTVKTGVGEAIPALPRTASQSDAATTPVAARPARATEAAARGEATAPARPATAAHAKTGSAGLAQQLVRSAGAEQEPLVGSADFGWKVLNISMTVGLLALTVIALVSCARVALTLVSLL